MHPHAAPLGYIDLPVVAGVIDVSTLGDVMTDTQEPATVVGVQLLDVSGAAQLGPLLLQIAPRGGDRVALVPYVPGQAQVVATRFSAVRNQTFNLTTESQEIYGTSGTIRAIFWSVPQCEEY